MRVADLYVFVGPSIYHARRRVIRVFLDLGRYAKMDRHDFEWLLRRVTSVFPELRGYEFEEESPGYIIAYLSLELQKLAGSKVDFCKPVGFTTDEYFEFAVELSLIHI